MQSQYADRSKEKVMLKVFFDVHGLIYFEFIAEVRTVIAILRRLRGAVRRKDPICGKDNHIGRSCRFLPISKGEITTQGRFASAEEVKIHATRALRKVTKNGLQECFEKWYGRWHKCVTTQGAYFEVKVAEYTAKNKKDILYPNIPSAIRPIPHCPDIPVLLPPESDTLPSGSRSTETESPVDHTYEPDNTGDDRCFNQTPVRSLHGRSLDGFRCRYCNEIETLAHVLGSCQHGELLRNSRHHNIRKLIAQALRKRSFEVHEEVHCVASEGGGIRRADIVALDKTNSKGFILDPTVRFEMSQTQPFEVNKEKQHIYEPTIPYFREKYQMKGT
ncbi:hypothetical protein ANN_14493 [Periplaneta americana]|uniref:Uncharacterized protein n=1 Tax=Periplaneta americana TaxID=6978 RepID=A0ABQ8SXN8_PERAM|nr:hypothetical protein ANN_14493 [Periplaneta americana]